MTDIVGTSLPEDRNRADFTNIMLLLSVDIIQKDMIVLVTFSHVLFSLLSTQDDLMIQALVWLHMVQFRVIRFGMVQFGASYMNLRQPHLFKN